MGLIAIPRHPLGLIPSLQGSLVALSENLTMQQIPLQACFQRRGLGFRSAIALQVAPLLALSPPELAEQYLAALTTSLTPTADPVWSWEAIATERGWLEFSLVPSEIGDWLDSLQGKLREDIPSEPEPLPPIPFSCHYLHARCYTLVRLAAATMPQYSPQWHFQHTPLPPWEQQLLEAIAHFGMALELKGFNHRRFLQVEQAFWQFQRHCPLFHFLQTDPSLGCHYWQWLQFLQDLFCLSLQSRYGVTAIVDL